VSFRNKVFEMNTGALCIKSSIKATIFAADK
jgi:hypothetical protein